MISIFAKKTKNPKNPCIFGLEEKSFYKNIVKSRLIYGLKYLWYVVSKPKNYEWFDQIIDWEQSH